MTATPAYAPSLEGNLRVGHVLSRAWDVFSANFVKFVIITAIVTLPNTLLFVNTPEVSQGVPPDAGFFWRVFGGLVVAIFLNMLAQAVILYIAFQYLRGRLAPLGDALQHGLSRLLPIIGVVVLSILGIWAGLLLLIVPGIMLALRWMVAMPVCVVERLGPVESLKRSAVLTKGYRWKIFGIFLLLWLINIALGIVIKLFSYMVGPTATLVINFLWTAVWAAYFNSLWVMIYHDLRVAKEGVDTEQIASVFD